MSKSLLHDWEADIEKYSFNVAEMLKVAEDIYNTAYARGKAQEKTKWIPVSERLPENNGTYLVWDKYGYQISDFNAEEQTFGFLNGCNFDYETGEVYPPCWVEHDTVIAWMPLPEPMKEGD